jgi:hypothetical protein
MICPSLYLSICTSLYLSLCPSVHLSTYSRCSAPPDQILYGTVLYLSARPSRRARYRTGTVQPSSNSCQYTDSTVTLAAGRRGCRRRRQFRLAPTRKHTRRNSCCTDDNSCCLACRLDSSTTWTVLYNVAASSRLARRLARGESRPRGKMEITRGINRTVPSGATVCTVTVQSSLIIPDFGYCPPVSTLLTMPYCNRKERTLDWKSSSRTGGTLEAPAVDAVPCSPVHD